MEKFEELLKQQLQNKSFKGITINNNESMTDFYIREENPIVYLLSINNKDHCNQCNMELWKVANDMGSQLEEGYFTHVIALSLYIGKKPENTGEIEFKNPNIHGVQWYFDPITSVLETENNQPNKLLGIEKILKKTVEGIPVSIPISLGSSDKKPWVCFGIFGFWIIILLYTNISGQKDSMTLAYGLSQQGILSGEYYRLFTSMFLHGGIVHLLSNSIFLFYFGIKAERIFGAKKFIVIYLVSGFTGGITSVIFHNVLSIGASGATCGILGAMLVLTKKYGERYADMNYSTMLLLAFVSIGFGFMEMGIDNYAHLGGFFGGILCGAYSIAQIKKKQTYPQKPVDKS